MYIVAAVAEFFKSKDEFKQIVHALQQSVLVVCLEAQPVQPSCCEKYVTNCVYVPIFISQHRYLQECQLLSVITVMVCKVL